MADHATSEVGSAQPNESDTDISAINKNNDTESEKWRAILEMQNKNFMEIIKAIKNPTPNNEECKQLMLPKFNPDVAGSDAVAWCSTAQIILTENPLEGSALIIALSKCLLGCASQWLSTICFVGITWSEFKDLFIHRFGGFETPAATLINLLNSKPNANESLSVFGSRLVTSLLSSWQNMKTEEIAVSVVLAHVARIDNRLQRTLFTTKITSRVELQQELKAFTYVKNNDREPKESIYPDAKRIKLSPNIKCHYCGKIGHKIAECRAKERNEKTLADATAGSSYNKPPLTCYKCGQPGHIASRCSNNGSASGRKLPAEKGVHICTIEPMGTLIQSGESFSFCFDTGAECSLMTESIAAKFSGKRISNVVHLKGIGDTLVYSMLQILSNVKIDNIMFEILFHIIPDNSMKFEVIVGREILGCGIGVEITANKFKIFRTKNVNVCSTTNNYFDISKIDTELLDEDKSKLISLLKEFSSNFIEGIPCTRIDTGHLEIRLIDPNKIVQRRPYRLSEDERKVVRDKIKVLIEAKIIRPSRSPFASPILLVKKKDGSDRMCVDYRELNRNTISDKYPLPLIADQINRLRGAKFFTVLDMASGYHQVPVHENSIERTAFVTPDGQFEYLAMPFGLKNAPSVFQRAVMNALGELVYSFVIIYMDDIMIVASTREEAFLRLKTVLGILAKSGFSFNIKKCSFLKSSVEYLGYEVKAGELGPNPRKVKALTELPPPQSVAQLRQFNGLASYFRQFVHRFSELMRPLYFLTSAKKFSWQSEHEQVRRKIISILTSGPLLMIFDPQYPIELHTDASAEGYGAILLHKVNGTPHVVEYFSKRTTGAESRYHSYELETLAVVNAVKYFRHYLLGRKFIVLTDCNALKATRNKIELTPRVHRWWAYLQSFDFEILYKDGKRMAHVDFFSRNHIPDKDSKANTVEQKHIQMAEITNDWLLAEQQKDSEISSIVNKLLSDDLNENVAKTYEIQKRVLFRRVQRNGRTLCLPVVPRSFRWSVINNVHEAVMHLGYEKTLDKVYDHFWFENMGKYVRKFVNNCVTCRLSKPLSGKVPVELHSIPKINIPWHTVHVDITGKLSGKSDLKEYIIVLIDAFTKYVLLYHINNIDSVSCIKALRSAISLFGVPSRLIADQGRCFTGKQFTDFCAAQNIKLHLIATGASRANGQVERVMSTLKGMLTAVETSKRIWQDALNEIQLAMNCTTNRVTKASPLELLIGKVARPLNLAATDNDNDCIDLSSIREEAEKNMKCNATYDKRRFDCNKAKVIKFNIGDYVLLKAEERHQTKLDPKYRGPFQVVETLDNDRYVLKSLNSKRTYKYASDFLRKLPESGIPEELESSVESDGESIDEHVEKDVSDGEKEEEDFEKEVNEVKIVEEEEDVETDVNKSEIIVKKDVVTDNGDIVSINMKIKTRNVQA